MIANYLKQKGGKLNIGTLSGFIHQIGYANKMYDYGGLKEYLKRKPQFRFENTHSTLYVVLAEEKIESTSVDIEDSNANGTELSDESKWEEDVPPSEEEISFNGQGEGELLDLLENRGEGVDLNEDEDLQIALALSLTQQ